MSILRVFRTLILVINGALTVLGLYGFIWRPLFRAGQRSSPYWLVRLYSYITPLGAAVVLALLIVFWFLGLLSRSFAKDGGKAMNDIFGLLKVGLLVAVIAMLPSWFVSHSHIESETYNSGNFNLLREESMGKTSLMLVECTDPGQLSCKTVARQDMFLPEIATPMPTVVVTVEGLEVILKPNYVPTATPAVRFGIEASTDVLGVRIGNDWTIVATPDPEAE